MECYADEGEKEPIVIFLPYAIVNPTAMMIKAISTSVTLGTVLTVFIGFTLAKSAEMNNIN